MPARPVIDADDPVVADLLDGTIDLIVEAGGWVEPRAVLEAREGQLCVRCDVPDDSPLAVIPREAMVRVDAVGWADDDERLVIEDVPDDIGDVELQMLYLQAALHNQCEKLPWLAATHPAIAADVPDDLIDAVRAVIPSFRGSSVTARDLLWANRCFRLPIDETAPRVLVPIVDLLNHHRSGASGSWDGAAFTVRTLRPFGSAECVLDYGMGRDAMELAVVYGFADSSSALAHSAPLTTAVGTMGDVVVQGAGRASDGSWLPMTVDTAGTTTVLSHLTFSTDQPPAVIDALRAATGWQQARARTTVAAIIDANLDALEPIATSTSDAPAVRTLAGAASHQRDVLTAVLDNI